MTLTKQILVVAIAFSSAVTFGQKKEIKKAQKAVKSGDFTEAMAQLKTAEGLISNADNNLKATFYATQGEAYLGSAGTSNFDKMKMAATSFSKAMKLNPKMATSQQVNIDNLKAAIVNSAIKDQKAENYKLAGQKLYEGYKISKVDTVYLYFAAGNAVNDKDYDTALGYYQELLDLGYNGSETKFVATNKETGEEESFASKAQRDLMVKSGGFIKPEVKKTPSRMGEVLRNMTLIYTERKEMDKAKDLLTRARAENPKDVGLMRVDANLAKETGNMDKYNQIMNEIIAVDPTNPDTYFNLGIAMADAKDIDKAVEYYQKAIELKPDFSGAYINIGVAKLTREDEIIEAMNSLGTSRADDAKYDQLKAEREALYNDVIPYFEKATEIETENVGVLKALINMYSQVGDDAKYKSTKDRVAQLEGQ